MTNVHRDLVQFGGDLDLMAFELMQEFARRLGLTWTPHTEEVEALLEKFSAQVLLAGMTALRAELRKRHEDPASYLEDELLELYERRCAAIDDNRKVVTYTAD